MKIRAVLIDCWLTLIDFGEGVHEKLTSMRAKKYKEVLGRHGFSVTSEKIRQAINKTRQECDRIRISEKTEVGSEQIIKILLSKLGVDEGRESIFHDILEIYDNSLFLIDLKVREYSHELLTYLKDKGYKIGLVSNTSHGHVLRKILQKFGLYQYFDTMVFSDELGFRKPQPHIFNETLRLLDVKPNEAIHIGDYPELDVVGAKAANIRVIYLKLSNEPYPTGLPKPDATVTSLREVPSILRMLENGK
jgi:putative hydrolase of the HAD superfamily